MVMHSRNCSLVLLNAKSKFPPKTQKQSGQWLLFVIFCVKIWLCEWSRKEQSATRWQTITSCSLKKHGDHGPDKDSNNTLSKLRVDGTVSKRTILHVSIILKQKDYPSYFDKPISEDTRLCTFSVNEKGDLNPPSVPLSIWNNIHVSNTTQLEASREITLVINEMGKENITIKVWDMVHLFGLGCFWKWSVFQTTASWKSKSTLSSIFQLCPQLFIEDCHNVKINNYILHC